MPDRPRTPLAVLLGARRRMLAHRAAGAGGSALVGRIALMILVCAALAGAGWLSAGPLVEMAAQEPALGQTVTPGGPFADLAFWLCALIISVLSFRIMEAIYRRDDARILSQWPIPLSAQFADRFLSAGLEAAIAAIGAAIYLGAVWAASGDPRALGGALLVFGGLWVCLTLGFAVQLYAGVSSFIQDTGSPMSNVGRLDTGGGTAAAFTISPGMAMAGSLGLLLWMKMAVLDEFFSDRGTSRLFWIGLAVPLAVSLGSLWKARGWFQSHYPALLARFYEADLIQIDTGYRYHRSVTNPKRGLFERLVPDRLLSLYRKDALQFGRRYPVLRLMAVALWIIAALVASRSGPSALSAAVPVAFVMALGAPWARLYSHDLAPGALSTLPVRPADAHRARLIVALREVLILCVPSALLVGVFGPWPTSAALAAVVALLPLLLTPFLMATARLWGAQMAWLGGLAAALAALGLGFIF